MTAMRIRGPILVVGIGRAGSRLAAKASDLLKCDLLQMARREEDMHHASDLSYMPERRQGRILIDTGAVVNPTISLVRSAAHRHMDSIRKCMAGHPTVLVMGNLAGKTGCAASPVISEACAAESVISFAIMPFGYERSRLFAAGVALRRLRESSSCTIVVDNDSLLENNPDMTPKECYDIADAAIMHMAISLDKAEIHTGTDNLLVAGRERRHIEESLVDALKSLYGSTRPGIVKRTIIYVGGGENIPVGLLRSAAELTEGVLDADSNNPARTDGISMKEAATVESAIMPSAHSEPGIVMLSTVSGMEKFEKYDPLGMLIPAEKTLDWSLPEYSIDCNLDLRQLE